MAAGRLYNAGVKVLMDEKRETPCAIDHDSPATTFSSDPQGDQGVIKGLHYTGEQNVLKGWPEEKVLSWVMDRGIFSHEI